MAKKSLLHNRRALSQTLFLGIAFLTLLGIYLLSLMYQKDLTQEKLAPFYSIPKDYRNYKLGQIIKSELMDQKVPGGKAYRILYRSELSNRTPTVSSGMIIVSDKKAPPEGRPVVAWAHGTIGMGLECAPTRSNSPFMTLGGLSEMMQKGWVIAATDYYGLGTAGVERYLIGEDQALDVLNSVRAARNFKPADAGDRFLLWGHSQGGQTALFASNLAPAYVPELNFVAVAVAAPAAELVSLLEKEIDTAVIWVIGPEINVAWPKVFPDLEEGVLSKAAMKSYENLAKLCIDQEAIEAVAKNKLGLKYFEKNPLDFPNWRKALEQETARPVLGFPVYIAQGLADNVVLPNTTQDYIKKSCDLGSRITVRWMSGVGHIPSARVAGPDVVNWFQDRLSSIPVENNCDNNSSIQK